MYKRIIISVILSILVIIVSLGIASYITVNDTISRSLKRRVELANTIARHADSVLENNFNRLYDISLSGGIDFKDKNWGPEKKALEIAYQYSIFSDGIFLLDRHGNMVLTYPPRLDHSVNLLSLPPVSRVIASGKPVVSDIYTVEPSRKKVIYAMVPLKDKDGEVVGIAGGEINPTNYMLNQVIRSVPSDENTFMEIVDSHGVIIASNNPNRVFTGSDHDRFLAHLIEKKESAVRRCHRCHVNEKTRNGQEERSTDVLAFSPLEMAPWGVSILQPEKDVFAPASELKKTFLFFSMVSVSVALLMAVGMSRSIVKPVHELIDATRSIASGDMSKSIGFGGVDEIGRLSSSFEVMRVKLADSLETLQQYNVELENRVSERTKEIILSRKKVENLLRKVITAQEEERKRVARGLHDETMQALSAMLMKIEMCRLYRETPSAEKIEEMRTIALKTLQDLRILIQNLRPSILDDIGLEAAIQWLLDKHLGEKGINCFLKILGEKGKRFNPYIEITLFRIIQEVIVNIARHAEAENVFVILHIGEKNVSVDIEDDGRGFDVPSALKQTEDGRGLGLLGMRERVNNLDGRLEICSSPGHGARITVHIPIYS
ncbi:MAG: cache domain-containing protein [Nitrospirota bacterium]|nr:cache domain-containing protein [Nitrospirota bacterium]